MTPKEGLVIATKYQLRRMIRRGGQGSVWEALHLGLESSVVIKFVRFERATAGADDDLVSEQLLRTRFEREARTAAQIRSANVVQILDYGVDRGTPYLVMEMLEGEDLATRLQRVGRMSLLETASIIRQVTRALERAHGAGLVHRDLKPQNIYIVRDGSEEIVKVLDFGVAKELRGDRKADESTVDGVVIGTPSYMSPEQAMGRGDIDHRSDLWSLGVIAFRALTGQKPFEAALMLEAIVKICSAPLPAPSSIAPDLGKDVDLFFERALARPPELRFQTARELAQALDFLATGGTGSVSEGLPAVGVPKELAAPIEAHRNPATSAPTLDAMTAGERGSLRAGVKRPPWLLLAGGGAVAAAFALGFALLRGSGAKEEAAGSPVPSEPSPSAPALPTVKALPPADSLPTPSAAASVTPPAASASSAPAVIHSPAAPSPRPSGKRPRPNVGY